MSEDIKNENVQFAAILVQFKDGNFGIQAVDGVEAPNKDQLYSLLGLVKRNIESEHAASVLFQVMQQLQTQSETNGTGEKRTESGIVVPR